MLARPSTLRIVRICAFLIFLGRGYQYIFFDAPFRAVLWDENLLKSFVEFFFSISWNEYVTNLKVDRIIQKSITINGIMYIWAAIASLLITYKNRKWHSGIIYFGVIMLVLLSLLSTKEDFLHYGQFFEHSIQIGIPILLLFIVKKQAVVENKRVLLVLKILIAVTFVSHGLYALGYYPVPGHFVDMTILSTEMSQKNATLFLYIAGILDIVISVLIFFPKIAKPALLYACFWGLLTAFARTVANFNSDFLLDSLHQSLYQTIYRLPHGIIPFLAFKLSLEMGGYRNFAKHSHL